MAPITKPKGKISSKKGIGAVRSSKPTTKISKSKPATKAVKTKPVAHDKPKKKKRTYSEAELNIPKLNGIVPAGVQKPKGKKKGKVFVDDQESMMTILAMVNAEKEGAIESKMMRARQMEEIREARQKEAEAKAAARKEKLEDTKNSLRKRPKRKADHEDNDDAHSVPETATKKFKANRKRVSFG